MARYRYVVSTNTTSVPVGSVVHVWIPGTTNNIPYTIFADATSATTLANPFTTTVAGNVVFYLAQEEDVKISVSAPTGTTQAVETVTKSAVVKTHATMSVGGRVTNWFTY